MNCAVGFGALVASLSFACSQPDAAPPTPPVAATVAEAPATEPSTTELPEGYWDASDVERITSRMREIVLAPDLSSLTTGERACVDKLLQVGQIVQDIYESSRHAEALAARAELERLAQSNDTAAGLLVLYRLYKGPIGTSRSNERVPFLPVAGPRPGVNVYPVDATREELDAFMAAHPATREDLLHPRTVVRRATAQNRDRDLAALQAHPIIAGFHGAFSKTLQDMKPDPAAFYAAPYAVAYAESIARIHGLLEAAAASVQGDDAAFADYLRKRAKGLASNDYEEADGAWVTSKFGNINAQVGAYEVYDDALYGAKTFFGASILLRDRAASEELRGAISGLQKLENSLPYRKHKKVREDIPVGIYRIIADFGQARGANTASILPNEAHIVRKYGRTILLRANILRNEAIVENSKATWRAGVDPAHGDDLNADGRFQRTLWHEIGHYVGVDMTKDGQLLDVALDRYSASFEEMKSDLVSLYAVPMLKKSGYHDDKQARAVYASGIRRTMLGVKPRPTQPYQTMQLMQMNYFLEKGLVTFDKEAGVYHVHYDRYHDTVKSLLREVLAIQYAGDPKRAGAFVERYTTWDPDVHGVVASKMGAARQYGAVLVRYAALGEG